MKDWPPQVGAVYQPRKSGSERTVRAVEYDEWPNDWWISWRNKEGREGRCIGREFRQWMAK